MPREADAIRRQYYKAPYANRVQHVFEFHGVAPEAILGEFIDVQTFQSLKPIAATLTAPVELTVPLQ